ncbi:MAG: M20 family metallo-hydrolase [Rickettsiales bacterium]|nr:M20 family metallo-hydrolase [Rickettsiales bacterium]
MNIKISSNKMIQQLKELGNIGIDENNVRSKLALTENDKKGRDLVVGYMRELDLDIRIDKIGNVMGIYNPENPGELPQQKTTILMGSHIDSVVNAGIYDGCVGVIGGLAVIRAIKESGIKPSCPLAVVFFTNEEGYWFKQDMLGSLTYVDNNYLEKHLNSVNMEGKVLKNELKNIGYEGKEQPGFLVPKVYLEMHIEQGPVLETEGYQIGVVTGVQGMSWSEITVNGAASHAGMPTSYRHDAGMTAYRVAAALKDITQNSNTLATVGSMIVEPSVYNIVPVKAKFMVDLRNPNESELQKAERYLDDCLRKFSEAEKTTYIKEVISRIAPIEFDKDIVDRVEKSAKKLGYSNRRIVSGAGHDAQVIASHYPTSMIFIPSKNGISHSPLEFTEDKDFENGANVLLSVVMGFWLD